jgi:hypothetical protein
MRAASVLSHQFASINAFTVIFIFIPVQQVKPLLDTQKLPACVSYLAASGKSLMRSRVSPMKMIVCIGVMY